MPFCVIPNSLKSKRAGAEEGFPLPPLSLANLLEEGCPRPCIRRSTTKPYNFGSTDPLLHHVFYRQLLSWCVCWYEKYNVFIMLRRNVTRLFTIMAVREKGNKVGWGDLALELWGEIGKQMLSRLDILRFRSVCKKLQSSLPFPTRFPLWVPPPPNMTQSPTLGWGDLPLELWGEIGKRMSSRLDILRFRSVCKKLRSSLPFPTRFPLWVPPPPNMTQSPTLHIWPYVITEFSVYKCRGINGVLTFEDTNQAGKFYAFRIYTDTSTLQLRTANLDRPMISLMTSRANPYSRMSCVSTTYRLRMDLSHFGSNKEMDRPGLRSFVVNGFAKDIVVISSNAGVNPSCASASDLTVVALLYENGRLALLRLGGGSYENLVWDTDFCNQVFKDIVTYRGQLCALDPLGRVFLMDYNSLQMTQVLPPWDRALRAEFAPKY